jgi:hypothetical protein
MRIFRVTLVLVLVFAILMCSCSVTAQEEPKEEIPERVVFFSTEEDFVTQGPEPPDGNLIISDGDLLSSAGHVYMRNSELLSAFNVRSDLGLDAVDVIDVEERLVIFSTELDHPRGMFTAGDLLVTNGFIIPNAALLAAFDIPRGLDLGLDAVHLKLKGKQEDVIRFFDGVKEEGRESLMENPKALMERLQRVPIDIWFSTEGTAPLPDAPGFLDGDLLSAATGTIVLKNADALPLAVPAGIPDRGVDFGMDAVSILSDPIKRTELLLFSTEINGLLPTFTDGDALRKGDGVVFPNISLISAFEPKVRDLGLDALSLAPWWIKQCKFTEVGGVEINLNTWNFVTGYVDPPARPDPGPPPGQEKDHAFANWVSIRGKISDDVVEYRVLFRPEAGADSPILWPPGVIVCFISLTTDGFGWMDAIQWNNAESCLPGLVLAPWDTSALTDGKYILTLECKDANGNIKICDVLPVQIDNTRPDVLLSGFNECQEYKSADMPLEIKGAIRDDTAAIHHFYAYRLSICGFGDGCAQFEPPSPQAAYYYYQSAPCPLSSAGTGPPSFPTPVKLGDLDIPTLFPGTEGGRYTVFLYAFDRSLRGWFATPYNMSDPFQPSLWSRNMNWKFTNFTFEP